MTLREGRMALFSERTVIKMGEESTVEDSIH